MCGNAQKLRHVQAGKRGKGVEQGFSPGCGARHGEDGAALRFDQPEPGVGAERQHQDGVERDNAATFNGITGTIPALKELVENPQDVLAQAPWIEPTFKVLPYGKFAGNLTDRDRFFYQIAYPAILQAMQGGITAEEAAAQIHQQANEMVDEVVQ